MKSNPTYLSRIVLFALLPGCTLSVDEGEPEMVGSVEQDIIGGTQVTSTSAQYGSVVVYNTLTSEGPGWCTGTLINRNWVLTAKHCVKTSKEHHGTSPYAAASTIKIHSTLVADEVPPSTAWVAQEIKGFPATASSPDIVLLRLSPDTNDSRKHVGLWNGNDSSLSGQTLRVMGYGASLASPAPNDGWGTLRTVNLTVSSVSSGMLTLNITSSVGPRPGDSGGPSLRLTDQLLRSQPGVAGVHSTTQQDVSVAANRGWIKDRMQVIGDVSNDGRSDVVLVGGAGWTTIRTGYGFNSQSMSTGADAAGNAETGSFTDWAQWSGAKKLAGDFNGDGRMDIALTGAPFTSMPVAFRTSSGYTVTNSAAGLSNWTQWAALSNMKALSGDFDGDGYDDIAMTSVSGWGSVPIARSKGDGTFTIWNKGIDLFATWAAVQNVTPLSGDFDGDDRSDIALIGGIGFGSIPVAFSNGDGSFTVKNQGQANFAEWGQLAGAKAVVGDYNGDGRDDIALTGVSGWGSVPVALSNGDGSFSVQNKTVYMLPTLTPQPTAKVVAADVNQDGRDDLIVLGISGVFASSFVFATSLGDGGFSFNAPTSTNSLNSWATASGVVALTGRNSQ